MTKLLLSIHVLAAIVAIGPVTVAASMFPAVLRRAQAEPGAAQHVTTLRLLHRISRIYAAVGIVIPVFGVATAKSLGVLGDAWLIVSIVLTAIAAGVLMLLVLPRQESVLADFATPEGAAPRAAETGESVSFKAPGPPADAAVSSADAGVAAVAPDRRLSGRLAMYTGMFNLLWATVTVLMIIRPGSTTGA
ncbi:protease [Streptomyces varsoviensis]|uniref:protease n=1 Tax=Streptomyces varsoviensis TaxID=67373 RepID=UPI0033D466ED